MSTRKERYNEYINGPEWAELRQDKFAEVGRKCEHCGNINQINVHHIHYRNLYDCVLSDLLVLCETCHAVLHDSQKIYGRAKDRAEALKILTELPTLTKGKRRKMLRARRLQRRMERQARKETQILQPWWTPAKPQRQHPTILNPRLLRRAVKNAMARTVNMGVCTPNSIQSLIGSLQAILEDHRRLEMERNKQPRHD